MLQGGRQGALYYGVQSTPRYKLNNLNGTAGLQSLAEACQERMSYCIAYSPLSTSTPPGTSRLIMQPATSLAGGI